MFVVDEAYDPEKGKRVCDPFNLSFTPLLGLILILRFVSRVL